MMPPQVMNQQNGPQSAPQQQLQQQSPQHPQMNQPVSMPVYFSIEVSCVATGTRHTARSVASVALADQLGRLLYAAYIKQEGSLKVLSYLTPLTGLQGEEVEAMGIPLGKSKVSDQTVSSLCSLLVMS